MESRLLLVASPLLGSATWEPVAAALRRLGHDALAVGCEDSVDPPEGVVSAVVRAAREQRVVLVPHSNAGLYAPLLAEEIDVAATVYVDAALAGDGPTTPLAPPALVTHLADLADDAGLLPAWTQWWDEAEVGELFPDETTRAAVEDEQRRLPLSYFTSALPTPPRWWEAPAAYLGFGETYAEELDAARARDWPSSVLDGGHLHQLHEPEQVADAILDLLGRLRT